MSIRLFEAELAAFARAVGAGPNKQIVLVLDRAGWHASLNLRVPSLPEHVHLLFLPAYSPELQPAEHLWPLTNTILANRHFAGSCPHAVPQKWVRGDKTAGAAALVIPSRCIGASRCL